MRIRKGGITRHVSKRAFSKKWEGLGFEVVEENKEKTSLSDMTKKELYKLAQAEDIEGRSEMSKGELIAVIKE